MASFSTDFMMDMMDGDMLEVKTIAQMLFDLGPEMTGEIGEAIKDNDYARAGNTAHKLKSSLKMWRMAELADLALIIEENGRNDNTIEGMQEVFDKLNSGFEEALAGLKAELDL